MNGRYLSRSWVAIDLFLVVDLDLIACIQLLYQYRRRSSNSSRQLIVDVYEYSHRTTTGQHSHLPRSAKKDGELRLKSNLEQFRDGDDTYIPLDDDQLLGPVDVLSIIFYCRQGRSFARVYGFFPIEIHMHQEDNVYAGITDQKKFDLTTLHHEVGHAFGLGDTYIERDDRKAEVISHYNISDGGSDYTIGKQPLSVMNASRQIGFNYMTEELQLGADDIAGINWLYDYRMFRDIALSDCPADYLYEHSTKGCRPRYPLIFAVKQNDTSIFLVC